MKSKFSWYFKPDSNEIKEIWNSGILTLDANVLLDLYRYHENTRNSILQSVQQFKGRVWLSHQTAEEFFRNRAKVIVGSSSGFKDAEEELEKIRKSCTASIKQLKTNRIISNELVEKLNTSLNSAINEAEEEIKSAQKDFPSYLDEDPVLDKLLENFEGAIGEDFDNDQLSSAKAEGERRKKNKIPPGYMDDGKDGDRPYGDYYMWRQILEHAKSKNSPIILVTSERKEDWWERQSGKTIGPRQELLKEAHEHAGKRILIYQTDRFLQFSAEFRGSQVDQSAVEEIRAVDNIRSGGNGIVKFISQDINENSTSSNSGQLIVELKKDVFRFTGSGHFDPTLTGAPNLTVSLVNHPDSLPKYRIAAGTGTNHDFNIHLKSQDYGIPLPAGIYVFQYSAQCLDMDEADIFPQN